jgi:hypothetical protein
VDNEDEDGDDSSSELPSPEDDAGDRCSVNAARVVSLTRFGMGMTIRPFERVLTGLVTFADSGLLLDEQRESSRAAWPLVRFTFAACCLACCDDEH